MPDCPEFNLNIIIGRKTMSVKILLSTVALLALGTTSALADKVIGFSQIGSESGWRAAETTLTKSRLNNVVISCNFLTRSKSKKTRLQHFARSLLRALMRF
jgi:hypothetical protein